ncbi:MAG: DUF927 domain-containing protein [Methylococcaceae bacterium]
MLPDEIDYEEECPVSGVTEVTTVDATDDGACSGNPDDLDRVTTVTEDDKPKRPCYRVYDVKTQFGKAGTYYHGAKTNSKGEVTETNDYFCDPLHVVAGSCDKQDNNFGLKLHFKNQRGRWHDWLMPLEMLSGSCEGLRAELLKQGLRIDHHRREMLPSYLQSQRPKKLLECALKVGWHDNVYVLPDRVIGDRDDIFFQTDHAITAEYGQLGTLADWQQNISRYCMGNPLLLFQASLSFAGALLKKCHIDYVGFHIFGDSSTGKSTGHKIAASTWGGEGFRKSWKATHNGLEGAALLHNDGLLPLDELGDSDPREVTQTIYALGNGMGKQRANVRGTARPTHRWRIALLSNGEKTLESHFQEKCLAVKAGQEIRMLQIPVFGKYGAFDDLHGIKDARLFSDTLQENTAKYYGTAGIAYLEKLIRDDQDFGGALEAAQAAFTLDDMQPQERRAARSFALVAVAGELATAYGVTGWTKYAATEATIECFRRWSAHRGTGSTEDRVILEGVKGFIDCFGDSRFTSINDNESVHSFTGRAGYYSHGDENRTYLFNRPGLKEATKGYDIKRVIKALTTAGWLIRGTDGKPKSLHSINNKKDRFYAVKLPECSQ